MLPDNCPKWSCNPADRVARNGRRDFVPVPSLTRAFKSHCCSRYVPMQPIEELQKSILTAHVVCAFAFTTCTNHAHRRKNNNNKKLRITGINDLDTRSLFLFPLPFLYFPLICPLPFFLLLDAVCAQRRI